MFFIRAMVHIFSFGERKNILFKFASPNSIEHSIFHLMKISIPSHSYTFIICILCFCYTADKLESGKKCKSGKSQQN